MFEFFVPIQHDVDDVLYGAVTATYIVDHMFRRTGGGTPRCMVLSAGLDL